MGDQIHLIKEIVDRYDSEVGMLIPMMQDLQGRHGYLPADGVGLPGRQGRLAN